MFTAARLQSSVTVLGGQANSLGIHPLHHMKQTALTYATADRRAVLISHINITLVVIVVCHNEWLYNCPCSSQKLPSADAYRAFVNMWMPLLSFHCVTVKSPQVFSLMSHFSFSFSSPRPCGTAFVFSPTGPQQLIFSVSSHRTSWGRNSDYPVSFMTTFFCVLCVLNIRCVFLFLPIRA